MNTPNDQSRRDYWAEQMELGHRIEKVLFENRPGRQATANLYRPSNDEVSSSDSVNLTENVVHAALQHDNLPDLASLLARTRRSLRIPWMFSGIRLHPNLNRNIRRLHI